MANFNEFQRQFMYLFERIGEPLYLGPRGPDSSSIIFDVPMDNLSPQIQHASNEIRKNFTGGNRVAIPGARTPDLSAITRLCPRNTIFSWFVPAHRRATAQLQDLFISQQSREQFLAMASACRDSDIINCKLWLHAFASACLRRPDMRGFKMPALIEIIPDSFLSAHTLRQAREQAALPSSDRSIIVVDRNFSGQDTNPENRINYYREDVGINSHHWHWHLIYPFMNLPRSGPGSRDRRGELFYYMHHNMMARYESERLCNGLTRTRPYFIDEPIREGYFPKLTDNNSGQIWGSRQERTSLNDVNRPLNSQNLTEITMVTLEAMRDWRNRILEAIDTGVIVTSANQRMQLSAETGIDVLGDLIEASNLTPNDRFYGDFHNFGHVLIASAHDPQFHHRENIGVMGDPATAMRDPVFYRWHRYIDNLFDRYKQTLPPYTEQQLVWQGIQVNSIQIMSTGQRSPNILMTHWTQSDVDLSRGLDFGRTGPNGGPIWARIMHLDHSPFEYTIGVTNSGRQAVQGTMRIFMAPRNNEGNQRLSFAEQRNLMFELDKFSVALRPGHNSIVRSSLQSSVTIPWNQTFRDLESLPIMPTAEDAVCGCGWPQHMLLPKGSEAGILFDLFVMVTNAADDIVRRQQSSTEAQRQGCKDSVSYCGILDELYPDRKPMGFPFDRNGFAAGTEQPAANLDQFIRPTSNMGTTQVRIVHLPSKIMIRPGGAPANMTTVMPSGQRGNIQPIASQSQTVPAVRPPPATGASGSRPGATSPTGGRRPANPNRNPVWPGPGGRPSQQGGRRPSSPGRRPAQQAVTFDGQPGSPPPPPRYNRWGRPLNGTGDDEEDDELKDYEYEFE